jgi:TolA-binding protein
MPPKKPASSGGASSSTGAASSSASTTKYDGQIRPLLAEVTRVLEHQQQQHTTEHTYSGMVDQLSSQLRELEKPLAQLSIIQKEEQKRRKKESAAVAASSTHATATATAPASFPSQSQLAALASWLKAEAPECRLGTAWEFEPRVSNEEGTGVRATRNLEKDELFMESARTRQIGERHARLPVYAMRARDYHTAPVQ